MLLKASTSLNAPPSAYNGRTALQVAASGDQTALEMLLKAGTSVNAPGG